MARRNSGRLLGEVWAAGGCRWSGWGGGRAGGLLRVQRWPLSGGAAGAEAFASAFEAFASRGFKSRTIVL
jgi:hypothetical protein